MGTAARMTRLNLYFEREKRTRETTENVIEFVDRVPHEFQRIRFERRLGLGRTTRANIPSLSSLPFARSLSLSLFLCFFLSLSLSLSLSLARSLFFSLLRSFSLSLSPSLSQFLSVSLFLIARFLGLSERAILAPIFLSRWGRGEH